MSKSSGAATMSDNDLQDLVVEADSGARKPTGFASNVLLCGALLWSLFQLWIASPLPYTDFASDTLGLPIFSSTYARLVHLSFALFLAFLAYPALKNSPKKFIPLQDWGFAVLAAVAVLYLFAFKDDLANRAGAPIAADVVVSVVGVLLLLEAARRALGPPLVVIASVFLFYTFAGNMDFMPDVIAHKGQSLDKVASHQWLSTEGVFGVAIGVSTDFVFLFVLFGALLERAGAGNYFIKVAFSLLGHFKGGPAKAAVLSSAMTGLISGSSIANVVTTGTFTVPLMRKVGFSREKAGAVEVASSVNGQIMPPVMGAAAFLMVEYVGVNYIQLIKHAFIPACISYIALLYIVHLEALKAGMEGLPKERKRSFLMSLVFSGIIITSIVIVACGVYWLVYGVKMLFGHPAVYVLALLVGTAYIGLLWYASRYPRLEMDDPHSPMIKLPDAGATVKTGLHFLLPIVVLVWCLMIERLSPGLSAFWATVFMLFILVTQRPLQAYFRRENTPLKQELKEGGLDLIDGLITGARNMVGIGIATAAAGIVVGSVSLTGVGQVMTELIEIVSGGNFVLVLIFTALICLVLGMGLPTTANYIVVSSLMAGVIVELGVQSGLVIPLVAVHLFVFYFGIMADVTPPVGLASFAAAAVSGGDPIRTGVQAFVYSIRTVILPFIFIYNTELLLVGVDSWLVGIWVFLKSTFAILIFAASTQGFFIVRSKWYESILLLLVAFSLFRPGFWIDTIIPPYQEQPAFELEQSISDVEVGRQLKINVLGENRFGDPRPFVAYLKVDEELISSDSPLWDYGIKTRIEDEKVYIDDVDFDSQAERDGMDFDYEIVSIEMPQRQFAEEWIYLVALCVFGGVVFMQRRRKTEIYAAKS